MGYYSEVRFNTTKEGYERFKEGIGCDTREMLNMDGDHMPEYYDEKGDSVIFGWCTKWYDEFSWVRDAMFEYRYLREHDVPIEYIRVGEEMGDYDFEPECDEFDSFWRNRLDRHMSPAIGIEIL